MTICASARQRPPSAATGTAASTSATATTPEHVSHALTEFFERDCVVVIFVEVGEAIGGLETPFVLGRVNARLVTVLDWAQRADVRLKLLTSAQTRERSTL